MVKDDGFYGFPVDVGAFVFGVDQGASDGGVIDVKVTVGFGGVGPGGLGRVGIDAGKGDAVVEEPLDGFLEGLAGAHGEKDEVGVALGDEAPEDGSGTDVFADVWVGVFDHCAIEIQADVEG